MDALIINYKPEKDTKNTTKFAADTDDERLAGAVIYLNKEIVKQHGLSSGFTVTISAI